MYPQANNVEKFHGNKEARVQVLEGISCGIEQGEICVLLGPSGSSRSTFLNPTGDIKRIDKGELLIGGKDLVGMPDKELALYRRYTLGFVFQSYHLVSNLTVKESVESRAYLGRHAKSTEDPLERLGLMQHHDKYPNQLSGGQQQRCAIGRALAKNLELPLCDEPTGALDYCTSRDILRPSEEINRDFQTTVILVTHNAAFANMAHRALRLKDGRITRVHCNAQRVTTDALEWQVIAMRNPLHKSLKKEFLRNHSCYISLSPALILMIGVVTGFLSVVYSTKELLAKDQISSKVEDGQPAPWDRIDVKTKAELETPGLKVYKQFYTEQSVSRDTMARVYWKRSDINRITLHEGRMPNKQIEIALDRPFALKSDYSIRDTICMSGKSMTITGLILVPDYTSLIRKNSDMMMNPIHFGIAIVTGTGFQTLSTDRMVYSYSYYLDDREPNDFQKQKRADDIQGICIREGAVLENLLTAQMNQAISFLPDDMGSDIPMVQTLPYIILMTSAFIFVVISQIMIEEQASVIGLSLTYISESTRP